MGTYKHVKDLQTVLVKEQAVFGTAESSLTGTDAAEVFMDGSTLQAFEHGAAEIRLVNGNPGAAQSVIGPSVASVTLVYPIKTGNVADALGQWALPLKASGWTITEATDIYTAEPEYAIGSWKDVTIWTYSGNKTASKSFLNKFYNVMFGWKAIFDFRKGECYGKIEYTGKGVWAQDTALATVPSVTPDTVAVPALRGVSFSFFGDSDYEPLLIEFECPNDVNVLTKSTVAAGLGQTVIAQKPIKWHAILYRDSGAAPEAAYSAGTLGTIVLSVGSGQNGYMFASGLSKAQITDFSYGDENGVETIDLTGHIIDNSFAITIDTKAA